MIGASFWIAYPGRELETKRLIRNSRTGTEGGCPGVAPSLMSETVLIITSIIRGMINNNRDDISKIMASEDCNKFN